MTAPVFDEEPVDVANLAAYLKVSPGTVYRQAKAGEIPGFKIGGSWRFFPSEVIAAARPKVVDPWAQPPRARRRRAA